MAKKSGSATPGKGGRAGGGMAAAGGAPAKPTPSGAPGKSTLAGAPPGKSTPAGAPAKAAATAAGGTSDADGPCFEFRQVIDEDGNPVLRKFEVPCPEK